MEQWPGMQPSGEKAGAQEESTEVREESAEVREESAGGHEESTEAPQTTEVQQQNLTQSISGHGQVLLIREFWKQEEEHVMVTNLLEQAPKAQLARPSFTQDPPNLPSRSDTRVRRGPKRPGDSLADSSERPAAKSRRSAESLQRAELRAADERAGTAGTRPAARGAERGAQLLLVLCHAATLSTQLPRLQLLLQRVRARDRRAPAALVGILLQPLPGEEAESRRRLENLLCSVFAPETPAIEVHTAVFCPGHPRGILDVRRAASQAHRAGLVDRQTQTDGEGPRAGVE